MRFRFVRLKKIGNALPKKNDKKFFFSLVCITFVLLRLPQCNLKNFYMKSTTTTTAKQIGNALPIFLPTEADNKAFAKAVEALKEERSKGYGLQAKGAEAVLLNTTNQADIIFKLRLLADKAAEDYKVTAPKFAELVGYSVKQVQNFVRLAKAKAEPKELDGFVHDIEGFKQLNRSRLEQGKKATYGIEAVCRYLEGEDIYSKEAEEAKEEERLKKAKEREELKASKQAKEEAERKAEEVLEEAEAENSVLYIKAVSLNGRIKEDIQIKLFATDTANFMAQATCSSSEFRKVADLIAQAIEQGERKAIERSSVKTLKTSQDLAEAKAKAKDKVAISKAKEEQAANQAMADMIREGMLG
jgi:hypothetical protein